MTKTESCLHSGNIRLVGPSGTNTVEGRVEYCSNGVWGTISSSGFDTRDGEVVCRQLAHQNPRELTIQFVMKFSFYTGAQLFRSSMFGRGAGPVLFTSLSCTGTEYSIIDCSHISNTYYYSHYSDIGISCLVKG